jgi:hypothetical protein
MDASQELFVRRNPKGVSALTPSTPLKAFLECSVHIYGRVERSPLSTLLSGNFGSTRFRIDFGNYGLYFVPKIWTVNN